jgi:hypothetical protein
MQKEADIAAFLARQPTIMRLLRAVPEATSVRR